MKINFDSANIKFDLNKILNEINIVIEEDKVFTEEKRVAKEQEVIKMREIKKHQDAMLKAKNAARYVRGTSNIVNNQGVLNIISVSSILALSLGLIKKTYLENILPGNGNSNYILISNNKCEIKNLNIVDFQVIVKTMEGDFHNLGQLKKFDVNELREIIFIEDTESKKILEIKQLQGYDWVKIPNNKYYEVF